MVKRVVFLSVLTVSLFVWGSNLLTEERFQAVCLHDGKPTGLKGWKLWDGFRSSYRKKEHDYFAGNQAFTLDVQDGCATFLFSDPLHPAYMNKGEMMHFVSDAPEPLPPADEYRFTGRAKNYRAVLTIAYRKNIPSTNEWCSFDVRSSSMKMGFAIRPEQGGASISLADFKCEPIYHKEGGAIRLPEGGKLERILLGKDATPVVRHHIQLWKGWLWKTTGVALPLEVVEQQRTTQGALAFIYDASLQPGQWHIAVTPQGMTVRYGEELDLSAALFDYMYRQGYRWISDERIFLMPYQSDKGLSPVNYTVHTRFQYNVPDLYNGIMNGGIHRASSTTMNVADYYHLATPVGDHVMNAFIPQQVYYKTHPEYFMLDKNGKRFVYETPEYSSPCLSNPEVLKLIFERAILYLQAQSDKRLASIDIGDSLQCCVCPDCVHVNGQGKGYSNMMMLFYNQLGQLVKENHLKHQIRVSAYLSRLYPPERKPEQDNLFASVAVGHDLLPCTLHVNCELNQPGYKLLQQWKDLFGGKREKVGILTYRDVRPRHILKQLEHLNQYASKELLMFDWHGDDPAQQFIATRWNLGDAPEDILATYNACAYGNGAVAFTEMEEYVDSICQNYQHTVNEREKAKKRQIQHLCIRGGTLENRSVLTRKDFDTIYQLLDKAIAACGEDKISRCNLLRQKCSYLLEDLNKYRVFSCKTTGEAQAFAQRLKILILAAKEVPRYRGEFWIGVSQRNFLKAVADLEIPATTASFYDEPELQKFLANPEAAFKVAKVEQMAGGWNLPINLLQGGSGVQSYDYQCPMRQCVFLGRPSLGNNEAVLEFSLNQPVSEKCWLSLEGLDDDKAGKSLLRLTVNGKRIYEGEAQFAEDLWTPMGFLLEEGLQPGVNRILIENITPDLPHRSARYTDTEQAKGDSQWGWFAISGLSVLNPNGEFKEALFKKWTRWRQIDEKEAQPLGTLTFAKEKLQLQGSTAKQTGIVFCRSHQAVKLPLASGEKMHFAIKASGNGELQVGFWCYDDHNNWLMGKNQFKTFPLTQDVQEFTGEISAPERTFTIIPCVFIGAEQKAELFDFEIYHQR